MTLPSSDGYGGGFFGVYNRVFPVFGLQLTGSYLKSPARHGPATSPDPT